MTNNTYESIVEATFNNNVMEKIFALGLDTTEENLMQEVVDNLTANLTFLMTAVDPQDAGVIFGDILKIAAEYSTKAKNVMGLISDAF